jgi:hypothetical protein
MITMDTDARLLLAREQQEQLRRAFQPHAGAPIGAEPAPEQHCVRLLGRRRRRAQVAALLARVLRWHGAPSPAIAPRKQRTQATTRSWRSVMRTTALICAIVAGAMAATPIAPATAQASPIDMTGEDFRYLHAQAVADAKKRLAVTDLRKAVAQQRSRPPRMYDSRIVPG